MRAAPREASSRQRTFGRIATGVMAYQPRPYRISYKSRFVLQGEGLKRPSPNLIFLLHY